MNLCYSRFVHIGMFVLDWFFLVCFWCLEGIVSDLIYRSLPVGWVLVLVLDTGY
jgi:hypothetical protein